MTAYQKLKAENRRLKDDINTLVTKPESIEAFIIKKNIKDSNFFVDMVMLGDGTEPTLKGLLNIVN